MSDLLAGAAGAVAVLAALAFIGWRVWRAAVRSLESDLDQIGKPAPSFPLRMYMTVNGFTDEIVVKDADESGQATKDGWRSR